MPSLIPVAFGLGDAAFLPHGYCFLWQPELVIAHVSADAITAASYLSIPAGLFIFVRKRPDSQYREVFWLFAAFIVACGLTHVFDIITLWQPVYATQAVVKLITAGISAFTAISVWPIIPKALALPSPSQLSAANNNLLRQNEEIARVNSQLEVSRAELEARVAERTRELSEVNARLAARESYYRTLYHLTPIMMQTLDRAGRILDVNNRWIGMMGFSREEVIGRRAEEFACHRPSPEEQAERRSRFWDEGTCDRLPYVFARKDGTSFETEISGVTYSDAGEERAFFVLVDVTEREAADRQLRATAIELKQVNEDLARFAYVASHDLQEPLRKVAVFADMLVRALERDDREEVEYAAVVMRESALRARQLVADLLAYSRSTNAEFMATKVNVAEVVEATLSDLSEQIGQAGAAIDLELEGVEVMADRSQLGHVLQNLVSNALKFQKPKTRPEIRITAAAEPDGSLKIEVADNGIGFDVRHSATIFEPFKRLVARTDYPGSGIGLAICKSVCDRHGWRLECESRVSSGAKFRIVMPDAVAARARVLSA